MLEWPRGHLCPNSIWMNQSTASDDGNEILSQILVGSTTCKELLFGSTVQGIVVIYIAWCFPHSQNGLHVLYSSTIWAAVVYSLQSSQLCNLFSVQRRSVALISLEPAKISLVHNIVNLSSFKHKRLRSSLVLRCENWVHLPRAKLLSAAENVNMPEVSMPHWIDSGEDLFELIEIRGKHI